MWKDQLRDQYFDGNTEIKFDDLAKGFRKMFEKYEKADKALKKKFERGKKK